VLNETVNLNAVVQLVGQRNRHVHVNEKWRETRQARVVGNTDRSEWSNSVRSAVISPVQPVALLLTNKQQQQQQIETTTTSTFI